MSDTLPAGADKTGAFMLGLPTGEFVRHGIIVKEYIVPDWDNGPGKPKGKLIWDTPMPHPCVSANFSSADANNRAACIVACRASVRTSFDDYFKPDSTMPRVGFEKKICEGGS